ncbi:DNA polymerase V [Dryocola sp. BD626]|uniref:DNA polymerase V n=1 Tax=Dryocola sp. BD626 TaxID=3133273 RepID=UPI003F50940C
MARDYEIRPAFVKAIKTDPVRGQVVATADFVAELEKYNHYWSLRQANDWIAFYQGSFRDFTAHEGENKVYFLMNMGTVR